MKLHLDGARISNAAASLGVPLRAFTRDIGVDVLSFGGTKNGAMLGEAIVVLDPAASAGLTFLRKLNMQLSSKMRFVSAQLIALLEGDLWLRNASHSNAMAARLRSGVESGMADGSITGVAFTQPTQSNGVFATLPAGVADRLRESFRFYDWDAAKNEVRWMCSFDTTEADIDAFIAAIARETSRASPRLSAAPSARRVVESLRVHDGRPSLGSLLREDPTARPQPPVASGEASWVAVDALTVLVHASAASTSTPTSDASNARLGADQVAHLGHEARELLLLPAQLTRAVLRVAQHRLRVGGDHVEDLLRFDARPIELLVGAQVRVGLDLLSLSAHEALEVLGLRRHTLRVLQRRGHLLVGVLRDPLGVRDGLVVQHEELLLGVVLAARERRLELEGPNAQLAHRVFGIGARARRLAGDHRAQRGRALLGLGADRGGLLLGLRRPSRRRARLRARCEPDGR